MSDLVVVYTTATGQGVSYGSVIPDTVPPTMTVVTFVSPTWEEFRAGEYRWDPPTLSCVAVPPPTDYAGLLTTSLSSDPPVMQEVLEYASNERDPAPPAPTDYSSRRTQLEDDIDTLRAWVAIGRDDLAALQAIPEPTWQQELFIKILKFLILFSKVIWNALLRPQAGDLDPIPESAKASFMQRVEAVVSGPPLDPEPELLAQNVRKLKGQARIGLAAGGVGLLAGLGALLMVLL